MGSQRVHDMQHLWVLHGLWSRVLQRGAAWKRPWDVSRWGEGEGRWEEDGGREEGGREGEGGRRGGRESEKGEGEGRAREREWVAGSFHNIHVHE